MLPKLIFGTVGLFILFASVGIVRNQQAKIMQMPTDIRYQIITSNNTWPDQFFAASYELVDPNGFKIEGGYWTFEPSHRPLSAGKWEYHTETITMTEVNSTIMEIIR